MFTAIRFAVRELKREASILHHFTQIYIYIKNILHNLTKIYLKIRNTKIKNLTTILVLRNKNHKNKFYRIFEKKFQIYIFSFVSFI